MTFLIPFFTISLPFVGILKPTRLVLICLTFYELYDFMAYCTVTFL